MKKRIFISLSKIKGVPVGPQCLPSYSINVRLVPFPNLFSTPLTGVDILKTPQIWAFEYNTTEDILVSFTLCQETPVNIQIAKLSLPLTWFERNTCVKSTFPMRHLIDSSIGIWAKLKIHLSENGAQAFQCPKGRLLIQPKWKHDQSNKTRNSTESQSFQVSNRTIDAKQQIVGVQNTQAPQNYNYPQQNPILLQNQPFPQNGQQLAYVQPVNQVPIVPSVQQQILQPTNQIINLGNEEEIESEALKNLPFSEEEDTSESSNSQTKFSNNNTKPNSQPQLVAQPVANNAYVYAPNTASFQQPVPYPQYYPYNPQYQQQLQPQYGNYPAYYAPQYKIPQQAQYLVPPIPQQFPVPNYSKQYTQQNVQCPTYVSPVMQMYPDQYPQQPVQQYSKTNLPNPIVQVPHQMPISKTVISQHPPPHPQQQQQLFNIPIQPFEQNLNQQKEINPQAQVSMAPVVISPPNNLNSVPQYPTIPKAKPENNQSQTRNSDDIIPQYPDE